MPRGKNYVNNNKGMALQAPTKNKNMEQCFYGAACTRKDCIYRHDVKASSDAQKSNEPCMAYLAGICTFTNGGCRKRHPSKAESERLIAKYQTIQCRFGEHCKTKGCLYIHPGDADDEEQQALSFPPLPSNPPPVPAAVPGSAWRVAPVVQQQEAPLPQAPLPPNSDAGSAQVPASTVYQQQPNSGTETGRSLNIHAKEFVPGNFAS